MGRLFIVTFALLVGMFMTGCDKGLFTKVFTKAPKAAPPAPVLPSITITTTNPIKTSQSMDLGTVTLTNHYETCVSLGAGKNCRVTPKILDRHNVLLTLTIEARNSDGKMQDMAITQVTTRPDEPFEVGVGEFSFSFTPKVISE
jgi:hypothetical protein